MRSDGRRLYILDQTRLPQQEEWLLCDSVHDLVGIIRRLAIRGAPAIGISASIFLALRAQQNDSKKLLIDQANLLLSSRPTAVNLRNNLTEILSAIDSPDFPESVAAAAEVIYSRDIALCQSIARNGAELIGTGEKILTHCNTGSLATAGCGTAMGILAQAHREKKRIFVWIDETRPLLQGGRLTAWECLQLGIDHSIICDSAAAMLMRNGEVDRIIVGSDRIAVNGDFANKIGTYSLAVLANHHNIPFYVAAPRTTVDPGCDSGAEIPIEMREDNEVKGANGSFGCCRWSPEKSPAYNPAFDITPAELVSGWILDSGVFCAEDLIRTNWWDGGESG